ncbi:MAG: beta-propeller domain-containing protein, partial [Candidatus Altarchaeaceae archaeon]
EKIEKLESYDITDESKYNELSIAIDKFMRNLSLDERLRIENEMNNRMKEYYEREKRNFEKTEIVKIDIKNFEISAKGEVPGYLLNQFSMDEYKGNLRVATTIGERGFYLGYFRIPRERSSNDVYVLNENLKIIGEIKDLGIQERIYSVRFIEDRGYVVTFREKDPFYVLDLSNPEKPELKGELKIPGYSSYLHQIDENRILGIGKENWNVKISIFDVSDAKNPKELDKFILDETWSDILNTHHAFLLDKKHEIFFLPGGKNGYIFSYKDDNLKLLKAISEISAKRAIYIDDYLYVISNNKIVVVNENDWEIVNKLEMQTKNLEKSCKIDSDCSCGVHIKTGECFYGNKNFVDSSKQCPDFCTGIAGNFEIKCIEGECKQIYKERSY